MNRILFALVLLLPMPVQARLPTTGELPMSEEQKAALHVLLSLDPASVDLTLPKVSAPTRTSRWPGPKPSAKAGCSTPRWATSELRLDVH